MATIEGGDLDFINDQLELVPKSMEDATIDIESEAGFESTAQALRKSLRGTHFDILQKAHYPGNFELHIPLCRMLPMPEVRIPLKSDVDKLKGEFVNGYRPGSACFYVALKNFGLMEKEVASGDRAAWSDLWKEEDRLFEEMLKTRPEFAAFSNKYFFIWDGNHRHSAWMEVISQTHPTNRMFHQPIRAVIIVPLMETRHILLNAMTDLNK